MADAIRFKELLCCSTERNKTIEETTGALFSFAGLHDRSFDDELSDAFATLDGAVWDTGGATGAWAISSNQLQGTGTGAGAWEGILSLANMPPEAVVTVYKNGNRGGLWFRMTDLDNGYLFFWTATTCGFQKNVAGSLTDLVEIPKAYTGEGDITLSWREIKFAATADERWLFMAAWMDEELMVTGVDDISDASPGKLFGFAVYDSDVILFDDVHIPELTEIIDLCPMDIGQSPGSALSRMIGKRHIKYFLRYDATLRMFRPATGTSVYTYDRSEHVTKFDWIVDGRDLIAHWRQVGAWEEADLIDTALVQRGIGTFYRDDNADLLTEEACYDEAGFAIQRRKENADRIELGTVPQVLQEPEDIVEVTFARDGTTIIDAVDYIVDLERPYQIAFRGGKLGVRLFLRKSA